MEVNEQVKTGKKQWGRITLIIILLGLGGFSYIQLSLNYRKIEKSNGIIQALLDYQMGMTRQYAKELDVYKENLNQIKANLDKTEVLLGKIQKENNEIKSENSKLQEKLVLLDKMGELEQTIGNLRVENTRISKLLEKHKSNDTEEILKNLDNIVEGRDLLAKHLDHLRRIKVRIKGFKKEAKLQKMAAQRERDQVLLLMGNNGYLVRNGKLSPVDIPSISTSASVNIDVKFVK